MAHVLIAGLGDLGRGLAQTLQQVGHRISAIRRGSEAPEGVDLYPQDMTEAVLLPPDPVDLLYIILTPTEYSEAGYRRAFLDIPARLLQALASRQPLPPTVFVSSTAVYGDDARVDEQTPPHPQRYNGRILLAAEEELSLRTISTVVRFTGIYGPGRRRLFDQVQRIAGGEPPPQPRWTNRIHRDDCVGLLAHLAQGWLGGDMQPSLVIGTDNEPANNRDVLNWLGEAMGTPLNLPTEKQPEGKKVYSRYVAESGFELKYPDFRAGYEEILKTESGK